MLKAILNILNGKEYYELTKQERIQLRNEEYQKILESYIMISSIFMLFGIIIIILAVNAIIDIPFQSPLFILIAAVTVFLAVVSVLMFIQRKTKNEKLKNAKFDLTINVIILLLLTAMTLSRIHDSEFLSMYVVGLIAFALLVRVKPHIVLIYFLIVLIMIFTYINAFGIILASLPAFTINVTAINIIIFFTARMLFVEHIHNFLHRKKIYEQNFELEKLAAKDFLTNFYNRRGFANRIGLPIKRPAAICLFDLDGLKLINDALGHEKGDKAILFTVKNIKEVFSDAFCARLGGDEFAVLAENTDEKEIAEKVKRFNKKMQAVNETGINVSASVGYAMITKENQIMESYKKAENIMYHLKLGARPSRKNRSMEALMISLYNYTGESERHCHSVGYIAQQILSEMGFNRKTELEDIKIAGLLHDIGKLSIPEAILKKESRLTDREWEIIKTHSEESYKIACGLTDDTKIVEAVLYHHERWDGSGYPYQLKGGDIPLFARILCVADSYDAMLSDRVYTKKKTHEQACGELIKNKGMQFDPEVVESFLRLPSDQLKF